MLFDGASFSPPGRTAACPPGEDITAKADRVLVPISEMARVPRAISEIGIGTSTAPE